MANRLAGESSPYLLQHVDNPVDWYPWGPAALSKAKEKDRPILLSIGYSACHWCHVMAHESFEDEETAAFMNRHFINIKVDREERPDLDSIYMNAVVALTGHGGWPMTVILTPEGEPFFGGTYFPPVPRYGMPSFKQVLASVVRAWQERRHEITDSANKITQHIAQSLPVDKGTSALAGDLLEAANATISRAYEPIKGGFGRAPKFPQAMTIEFLLRRYLAKKEKHNLNMVTHTLNMMANGGIYDHLGGGFARYSTDDDWLVPHFEKMLYDNALLTKVYAYAWQITRDQSYQRIVEQTVDWVLREMRHEEGGFFSSIDADSEGEEGRFYVWQADEIREILGRDADLFMEYYGVTKGGNWEGSNILAVARSQAEMASSLDLDTGTLLERLDKARRRLYAVRSERTRPGLDDKILTAWNGLMIGALAEAGQALDRPAYVNAAIDCAGFLYKTMRFENGRLYRTWREGNAASLNGYLEDYAFLAEGLLSLYQATFNETWYAWAEELVKLMVTHFRDPQAAGFFDTSDDHEQLIHRPKDWQDNATPSSNSAAAHALLKLSLYTGRLDYWDIALESVASMQRMMRNSPTGFANWLCAADFIESNPVEIAIIGDPEADDTLALVGAAFADYRPNKVVAVGSAKNKVPLLLDRPQTSGRASAYVCRRFVCSAPVDEPQGLMQLLA